MMESTKVSLVLRKYYAELVSTLGKYLNDLLVYLVSEGVIKIDDKNTIKKFGETPASDKAEYLLDNYVNRPLDAGITDNFLKLIKVMEKTEIPGCNPLAAELSKALECDTGSATPTVNNRRVSNEESNSQSGMNYLNRFS